jgi:hypothetical protein
MSLQHAAVRKTPLTLTLSQKEREQDSLLPSGEGTGIRAIFQKGARTNADQ